MWPPWRGKVQTHWLLGVAAASSLALASSCVRAPELAAQALQAGFRLGPGGSRCFWELSSAFKRMLVVFYPDLLSDFQGDGHQVVWNRSRILLLLKTLLWMMALCVCVCMCACACTAYTHPGCVSRSRMPRSSGKCVYFVDCRHTTPREGFLLLWAVQCLSHQVPPAGKVPGVLPDFPLLGG